MEKASVKILIEGYARQIENGWIASSTCCLVNSSGLKIITDPGCNRQKLMEALAWENLSTKDIDYVFLSHGHPDHILLAGIFEQAQIVTYDDRMVYREDRMERFDRHILGPFTEIVNTPGHTADHLSLLVRTNEGIVAISGDVFWWIDGEEQILSLAAQSLDTNREQLAASQSFLLKNADFIIPGHGRMFPVHEPFS